MQRLKSNRLGDKSVDFIDLFAGLGGFHVGLSRLGHRCVMACELDSDLRALYAHNFGLKPLGDIRKIVPNKVPFHQLLCAGFPCQPFSKAGEQLGLSCTKDGDLFGYLVRIIRHHRPPMLILENVANLAKHDEGKTYQRMVSQLKSLGYSVDQKVLSPHQFGIPQIRERLFIIGIMGSLETFHWPAPSETRPHIRSVLDSNPPDAKTIPSHYASCLDAWQEFIDRFPRDEELPSFPIWSMEFGADYPYEDSAPTQPRKLSKYRGSYGRLLKAIAPEHRLEALPSYARSTIFPPWKQTFIRQNRALYARHHGWIDKWIPRIINFPPSLQKFEWNCKGEPRSLAKHILQFRASGVRVKRADTAPALIAMTTTQVPIIGAEGRYMTVRECARLQGLGCLAHLPPSATRAYRALGNAVNADLVESIAERLIVACNGSYLMTN